MVFQIALIPTPQSVTATNATLMTDVLQDEKALPLQVFTTAASLLELVDKRVVLTLRDGRILYAVLRSFDAYGNVVLQNTLERIFLDNKYAEQNHGVWIIRGENIALVGELDLAKQEHQDESLQSMEKIDFKTALLTVDGLKDKFEAQFRDTRELLLKSGIAPTPLGSNPYLY